MPPELHRHLLRKGVGAMARDRSSCSGCHRSPLPGELMHELESGQAVCSLCLQGRATVASRQVGTGAKRLAVTPVARAA